MPLGSLWRSLTPSHNQVHEEVFKELRNDAHLHRNENHHEFVQEFKQSIDADQEALFNDAIYQAKHCYSKWTDPSRIVNSFEDFLSLLDRIVVQAPARYIYNDEAVNQPVATPIFLILDLISNTPAAYTLFTDPSFNRALRTLLNRWGEWLTSPESSKLLTEEWFSPEGLRALEVSLGGKSFDETYEHTAAQPQRFHSWDAFFTRKLRSPVENLRPIPTPPENSTVSYLYNACESTLFRTAENVKCHDTFWLKNQNYSLHEILGGRKSAFADKYAPLLEGGYAYQAFLITTDYHRWHCPIEGEVVHSVIEGTYYAVLLEDATPPLDHPYFIPDDPHGAIGRCLPWLNAVATRAVCVIRPTDPNSPVELVAFVAVGMAEISTCDVTYDKGKEGKPVHVRVGDELGTFRFGGSSYTIFVKTKPNYELVFEDESDKLIKPGDHRLVNSVIGQFREKNSNE